jgi:hypothetical protein
MTVSNLKVSYLMDKLLMDDEFSKSLQSHIENIMKDGKINEYDIPDIVLIICELIAKEPKLTLTQELLSELIQELIVFIIKKYQLKAEDHQIDNFNRIIESSIKLIMFQPKIKEKVNKCLNKLNIFCK